MKKSKFMDTLFFNENNQMLFQASDWLNYKIIQIAGKVARRIQSFLLAWSSVQQWQTIWLIKFWSQVSVLLPNTFKLLVKVWDKVIDGETVLAKKS